MLLYVLKFQTCVSSLLGNNLTQGQPIISAMSVQVLFSFVMFPNIVQQYIRHDGRWELKLWVRNSQTAHQRNQMSLCCFKVDRFWEMTRVLAQCWSRAVKVAAAAPDVGRQPEEALLVVSVLSWHDLFFLTLSLPFELVVLTWTLLFFLTFSSCHLFWPYCCLLNLSINPVVIVVLCPLGLLALIDLVCHCYFTLISPFFLFVSLDLVIPSCPPHNLLALLISP